MSAIDRLAELRAVSGVKDTGDDDTTQQPSAETSAELSESLAKYDAIKKGLDTIKANVQEVERLKAKNKTTANEKSRKEIMSQLDKVMSETNQQGTFIKRTLDEIKKDNDRAAAKDKDSAKAQMRRNLYQTHIRRFHQVMNDYNSAAHAFKQDLQKRTRREIKIVDDTISDAEIEKIVESGQANDVIKKALISDNLQDVVRVIEERHLDIMKLEQQVLEVYELFRDLATLVDLQKESLDVIENRIVHAKDYTEKAEVELGEAEDYQKKARNRRCCLLFILLGVLIAILAPSILKALDKI